MNTDTEKLLEQIESILNLLKDDFEKRKVEPVSKKRWRADIGKVYFSTNAEGLVCRKIERNNNADSHHYSSGDYSQTEEVAIKHRDVTYARQRIFDALRETEGDWVTDWRSTLQHKCHVSYNYNLSALDISRNSFQACVEPQWYSSEESCKSVMVSHKDDLLLVWGVE